MGWRRRGGSGAERPKLAGEGIEGGGRGRDLVCGEPSGRDPLVDDQFLYCANVRVGVSGIQITKALLRGLLSRTTGATRSTGAGDAATASSVNGHPKDQSDIERTAKELSLELDTEASHE